MAELAKTALPIIIDKYFWLLCILLTCINGTVWWYRAGPMIAENPALEQGCKRLIRSWLFYGNLPWLVMGAGIVLGGVSSTFRYFNPRNGPFVIAFYVTVVVLWILSFYWMFFRGGAEDLMSHPGLVNLPVSSPSLIKAYFLLCLAGGVVGLALMIFGNIPTPLGK